MKTVRLAIVGSRTYPNLNHVHSYVQRLEPYLLEIISGGAIGVDTAAETAAKRLGIPTNIFLPEWERLGKDAALIRNQHIVDAADAVVAFWDEKSRGTLNSITRARRAGKLQAIYDVRGKKIGGLSKTPSLMWGPPERVVDN